MFYNLAIILYDIAVHLVAPFSRKPRKMMKGHWVVYELLRQQLEKDARYIWFHAASLGEFEQGRPLIEKIRAKYPDYRILLTFFSPSGYEVRKNYRGADIVCYLPFDKPRNVRKFLDLVNPCMAFFIPESSQGARITPSSVISITLLLVMISMFRCSMKSLITVL